MPNDDFRRDLNNAFDRISGSPSSDLAGRVRNALVDAPERRGPAWLAGVAAVAIAALVVGALFVVGPLRGHTPTVPGGVGSSPSPSASATPPATPSPSPSPTQSVYVCGTVTTLQGSQPPQTAFIDAVRGGTHTGYDRITIEFSNGQPISVEVKPQDNATFTQGASGQTVQLQGSAGLLITIHGADGHTQFSGSTDFHVGGGILEARRVQDFEGVVQWALGLSGPACYHAFWLTGPNRLVIDVQT